VTAADGALRWPRPCTGADRIGSRAQPARPKEATAVQLSRLAPRQVTARIAHAEQVSVVDCRAAACPGRAAGALRLDPARLVRDAAALPRSGLIVLYAEDEPRAAMVARRLVQLGFLNELAVLAGGLEAWAQARLPIEPADAPLAA